ncbi:MAG: hypothetical protein HQL76_15300 [Magnetococcales bacterium]|nr:hypothetical protein [Magnetococcales bacterium]
MTQQPGSVDEGFQNRIAIMEGLLKRVVEVHLSTATHVKSLDEKLAKLELTATTLSNVIRKLDSMNDQQVAASTIRGAVSEETKSFLAEVRRDISRIHIGIDQLTKQISHPAQDSPVLFGEISEIRHTLGRLVEKLEQPDQTAVQGPVAEKLDALARVPEMIDKFGSQQSSLMQAMEKRIDPRVMIYLKPLIEMLEEEGRQAEEMKNRALRQLNDLLNGKQTGTDREISATLNHVGVEIEKCQAAFERTQQALQIVVTPFQNVGHLFRGNLETIVQAHDLMAQLHADFPRFLEEMKAMRHDDIKESV